MRITIDIEDTPGGTTIATTPPPAGAQAAPASATPDAQPPADVAARAVAIGAVSAGPAPAAPAETGPPPFTPDPGTTSTPADLVDDGGSDHQSAGAAPGHDEMPS